MVTRMFLIAIPALWVAIAVRVQAQPVAVGSGDHTAKLIVNFFQGPEFEFNVSFEDGGAFNGIDLLKTVRDADIGFDFHTQPFGSLGGFVDEIRFDTHVNEGEGLAGYDWWRYWWRESVTDDWTYSPEGATSRTIQDGYQDAWVFGRPGRPIVPPPAFGSSQPLFFAAHPIKEYNYPSQSTGASNDPMAVLGEPTRWFRVSSDKVFAASMVKAPFGRDLNGKPATTRVKMLEDGYPTPAQVITVAFDQPVEDDPLNPYGVDLIVYGNAKFKADRPIQTDTDMDQALITDATVQAPPVSVSVSPDGLDWYTYGPETFDEGYFPTQAFEWDSDTDTWGQPLDFSKAVDPALTADDFEGMTVSQAIGLYKGGGGGKGLDLAESGFDEIRFIRVEATGDVGQYGVIDGFADAAPVLAGDANFDGAVGFTDFIIFQGHYGLPGDLQDGDFNGDGVVGFLDFIILQGQLGINSLSAQQLSVVESFVASLSSASPPLPEPVSATLWLAGVGMTLSRRRLPLGAR